MSYRILIAEDDCIILKGLMTTFPWEREGFESPVGASNGRQALSLVMSRHFDIVLTDINMPGVDGIELTRNIRQKSPDTVVILFTGYESFSYAKEAVRLGVFDYLLKPVKPQSLKECLDRAKAQIREFRQQEERLERSMPLLRQTFLSRLYTGLELPSGWEEAGVGPFSYPCIPLIAMITDWEQYDKPGMDWDEVCYSLEAEMEEKCLGTVRLNENQVWGLFPGCEEDAREFLKHAVSTFSSRWGVSLLGAVGSPVLDEKGLADGFRETGKLVSQYGFLVHDAVLSVSKKEEIRPAGVNLASLEKELWRVLEEGREQDCVRLLSMLKEGFPTEEQESYAMKLLFSIGLHTDHLAAQHILPEGTIDMNCAIVQIAKACSVDEQFSVLSELVSQICHVIEEKSESDPLGGQMLDFIDQHISDPSLSLTMLGDHMQKSVSYLSSLFKKKNGISFSDYVASRRMERARVLLCTTAEKIQTISRQVGIANSQYFGLRFKQMYGATPSEYREKLAEK